MNFSYFGDKMKTVETHPAGNAENLALREFRVEQFAITPLEYCPNGLQEWFKLVGESYLAVSQFCEAIPRIDQWSAEVADVTLYEDIVYGT